jgi:predicted glycoside hydrolase/deacetylase ChbG (UPF0249 family)
VNATKYLIVNADDFGQSAGVNRGVARAHERGIVTSASLMVRWPAAAAAAGYAREHPDLGLGLHVDLGEWTRRDGAWVALYEVAPLADGDAVAAEASHQLAAFRALVGRDPTHVDSHQHVHRMEPVASILARLADELAVPLRHFEAGVRHCGAFYGQDADGTPHPEGVTTEALLALVRGLGPGVTELACHPGEENAVDSMYRSERAWEVEALCDPRVREAIRTEGIELRSFASLPR